MTAGFPTATRMIVDHCLTNRCREEFFKVDWQGQSLLHVASAMGRYESADLLIQRGLNLHYADERDRTALMLAAQHGQAETVRLLLKLGARVNEVGRGRTALDFAREAKHLNVVEVLEQAGGLSAASIDEDAAAKVQ